MVRHFPIRQQLKVLRKVLRATPLHSTAQDRVNPAFALVHPCSDG